MGEVGLILFGPEIDLFDAGEPALVVKGGGEFAEPGAHAVGDGVGSPDADLGGGVDAVFPAVGLFETDAEEADDGLVAHGGAILFGGFPHEPGWLESAASLAVGDEHGSAAGGFDGVEGIVGSAAVVGDGGGLGIGFADFCVPGIDDGDEKPLLAPEDVGFAGGILRVCGAGEIEAGGGPEVFAAVDAVAVAGAVQRLKKRPSGW